MEPKFFDLIEDYLASLPTINFQINQALEEDVSFEEIASIISADASLSARLLKIVNSPFYGFPQKIETIGHALSIVVIKELQLLALGNSGESVIPRLDIQTPKKIGFAKEHLEGVKEKVLSDFDEAAKLFL